MISFFGNPYNPEESAPKLLRTIDQMEDAMRALYWYRVQLNLEHPVIFRRRQLDMLWIPDTEYSMCSTNTKKQAEVLTRMMSGGSIDGRVINFYPMLDLLPDWMDNTYGS